jgi:hypothetical protein
MKSGPKRKEQRNELPEATPIPHARPENPAKTLDDASAANFQAVT